MQTTLNTTGRNYSICKSSRPEQYQQAWSLKIRTSVAQYSGRVERLAHVRESTWVLRTETRTLTRVYPRAKARFMESYTHFNDHAHWRYSALRSVILTLLFRHNINSVILYNHMFPFQYLRIVVSKRGRPLDRVCRLIGTDNRSLKRFFPVASVAGAAEKSPLLLYSTSGIVLSVKWSLINFFVLFKVF